MLSAKEVQHIAKLARIGLNEAEILEFQKDFSTILEYFEILREVDAASRGALVSPFLDFPMNITREDRAIPKDAKEVQHLLEMAPETKDGYLKVKSIL